MDRSTCQKRVNLHETQKRSQLQMQPQKSKFMMSDQGLLTLAGAVSVYGNENIENISIDTVSTVGGINNVS